MKKRLLSAAIMAALTISTATALAAPVITGDAQTMIQTTKGGESYSDMRLRVNFDFDLGEGMYAHARLMGIDEQGVPVDGRRDYAPGGTGGTGALINMEQMYLGAKLGQVDMKFGRQPLDIGRGMLADVNGIEGISMTGQTGDFTLYGFGGRSLTDDVAAASIKTKAQNVNMGAGYLKREANTYWSADADTNIADNVNLSGVYMANDTVDAKGFIVKATVGQVANKGDFSYAVSYRNIENGAVDGNWVTNGAFENSKGIRLEGKYKPTNNATLWVYQDITKQQNNDSIKPNQFRAELDFNF